MKKITACLVALTLALAAKAVTLTSLDPADVDNNYFSGLVTDYAAINFINNSSMSLDLYWIDYSGNRVAYGSIAALSSYLQYTFIPHPWLLVESGTGGTTAQGTGNLIAAFMAQTSNPTWNPQLADIAVINDPVVNPVPDHGATLSFAGLGVLLLVGLRRQLK